MSDDVKHPSVWDEMFPGRFLKAGLFKDKPRTLTIRDVTLEILPGDKGDQTRGILHFEQTPMQIAINKTNGVCLRAMFGKKPMDWIGKRVTFVPEIDNFGSEKVDAIRIKGSPDLTEDVEVQIKMPKKKPKMRRLVNTSSTVKASSETQAPADPAETVTV